MFGAEARILRASNWFQIGHILGNLNMLNKYTQFYGLILLPSIPFSKLFHRNSEIGEATNQKGLQDTNSHLGPPPWPPSLF